MKQFLIDENTLNLILQYIKEKPYKEVFQIFNEIQKNTKLYISVDQQEANDESGKQE